MSEGFRTINGVTAWVASPPRQASNLPETTPPTTEQRLAALEAKAAAQHERLEALEKTLGAFQRHVMNRLKEMGLERAKQRAINEALLAWFENGVMDPRLATPLTKALREALKP